MRVQSLLVTSVHNTEGRYNVELHWKKARKSADVGDNCVEFATLDSGEVMVRNSRHPNVVLPAFTPSEWDAFRDGMQTDNWTA